MHGQKKREGPNSSYAPFGGAGAGAGGATFFLPRLKESSAASATGAGAGGATFSSPPEGK